MKKILVIVFVAFLQFSSVFGQTPTKYIRLNQIGFLPFAQKIAVVVNTDATTFSVVDESNTVVFTNDLGKEATWSSSGETTKIADFSIVTVPGKYKITVPNYGESVEFEINDSVFTDVNNSIVRAFYYNRASTALPEQFAGIYARAAGHPDTVVIVLPSAAGPTRIAGDTVRTPKGWYDAGDYNKYIVNSGITCGTLLQAYETYSGVYDTLTWNIPESGNAVPDLLDEIKWNLDWMLTMQDPADGGVYNKCTEASFSANDMPEEVTNKRYVVAKGTAATLDFAAVMAMAARIYAPYYPEFADSCLAAAEYAWDWAIAHPAIAYTNPAASGIYPAVTTGGYGNNDFSDEKIWASSELFITTNNDTKYAGSITITGTFDIPTWSNVGTLCLYSLYNHRAAVEYKVDTAMVINKILGKSSAMQTYQTNGNPYKVAMTNFNWGSNSNAANQGVMMLFAYKITKDLGYLNAVLSSYDYLLGRNATEFSFVTGFGEKNTRNVHHRASIADGIDGSIPGFLAGGPNGGTKSDCSTGTYSTYPAKAYRDEICSFTTNEVAINWQAPLVFMSNAIIGEYKTWMSELPDSFAIINQSNIVFSRTQESTTFDVVTNTNLKPVTTDTWYTVSPDSITASGSFTLNITEFNNGDSIRNGSFDIYNHGEFVKTVHVAQMGKLTTFRLEAEDYNLAATIGTETTTDAGGGLNVGWIDNGDYLTYTLDIAKSGTYELAYRTAASSAGGKLFMMLQDSAYSTISSIVTGGWQTWTTIKDTAYFTEGVHEIRIDIPKGGFNLNYIDFALISESNIAPEHEQPAVINEIATADASETHTTNPVSNIITVFGLEANKEYTCTLYSMNGIYVGSYAMTKDQNSVPVTLPAGTYSGVVSSETSSNSFVIIVKE